MSLIHRLLRKIAPAARNTGEGPAAPRESAGPAAPDAAPAKSPAAPVPAATPSPPAAAVATPAAGFAPTQPQAPTGAAPRAPEPPPALEPEPPATDSEPTLSPVPEQTQPRKGVHADDNPTVEFSLPTSPVVLPIRLRPTGEGRPAPDPAPLSPMRRLNGNRDRWVKADPRKAKGPMINVLVVDREQCSCYLVKSILLGCRHGVSIAPSLEEAHAKIATGLFDVVFIDVGDGTGEEREFIRKVNLDMPHLPVVMVCREDVPLLEGCRIDATVRKPIRVVKVNEAARHAGAMVEKACAEARRRTARRLQVRVQAVGGPALECTMSGLSVSGVLLECGGAEVTDARAFQEFFSSLDRRPVVIDIPVEGKPGLRLTGRRAFAETTPDQKIRQVGLSIWPANEEIGDLQGLITRVA